MQVLWNSDLYGKYPIERFAITLIGKTILRSDVLVTEKLHKMKQTKTEVAADKFNFFLDTINLQKNPKLWLAFLRLEMNHPIGILLDPQMVP